MAKTTWDYSLNTEARRIIHCSHQMATGFYRVNNFFVLPFGHKLNNSSTVPFPDLPYNTIPRFWEKAKKVNIYSLPIKANEKFVNQVKDLLKEANISTPKYQKTKSSWEKAEAKVLKDIKKVIPSEEAKIGKIIIYPTILGTSTSLDYPKGKPSKITLYLRQDGDVYTITEALLTSITRYNVLNKLDGLWSESELLVDWLLTESSFAKVLKKYQPNSVFIPTIKNTRAKQSAKILKESDKFYKKLGLPTDNKVFNVKNGNILLYGRNITHLTQREQNILKLFVEQSNEIVTFDELADILFTNEDDYSPWAITKTVERLRNKLEENGISGSHIQTLRGQGYLLKN
jgi:hypothetical protein